MKREYAEACPPLLKDFLYYMETIRGRSPRTVDGYFIDLRTFLRYIKAVKVLGLREFDLSEITIDDLDSSVICGVTLSDIYGYLNFTLTERDNSAVTRARKVSSIRSFYKYITTKTDLLEVSPAKELDLPAIRNSLPKFLSLEESLDLLQTVAAAQNPRDFCMITFLINCGMRVSEATRSALSMSMKPVFRQWKHMSPSGPRFSRTGIAPMNRRCFSRNGAAGSLPAGWNRFSKNIWLLPVCPGGATPLTNCAIQPQH